MSANSRSTCFGEETLVADTSSRPSTIRRTAARVAETVRPCVEEVVAQARTSLSAPARAGHRRCGPRARRSPRPPARPRRGTTRRRRRRAGGRATRLWLPPSDEAISRGAGSHGLEPARRLAHGDEQVRRRDDIDLAVDDAVLLRLRKCVEKDAEHVRAVTLEQRSRPRSVVRSCDERLDDVGVDAEAEVLPAPPRGSGRRGRSSARSPPTRVDARAVGDDRVATRRPRRRRSGAPVPRASAERPAPPWFRTPRP